MSSVGAWFRRYLLQFIVLAIVLASMYGLNPKFHVEASIERLIPLGVIAAGLAVTMIAGEFDLSIASMAAFSGALTVALSGLGIVTSVIIAILVGILLGMLQGWAIARLGINSLVFTVGTLILIRGMTWLVCGGLAIRVEDITATDMFRQKILFLTPLSITALIIIIGLGVFLARTRWGKELYALGGARHEAIAAGVRYKRGMIMAFGISGGCGAVGGALVSALGGSAAPDALEVMLVTALSAVLVGGISLAGGRGTMVNVFLGFAIIAILSSGLAGLGAKAFVSELFIGMLLLVVVLFDYFLAHVSERERRNRLRKSAAAVA
ncbi:MULTISPECIES: ABC transporter permease [unclassified Cryobacterium]|uniref:ABC transporter permease n=1 Tax=unclassified Cryobacterium TaxID=2649013 RepID=UPI002AB4F833|nr:MULTISPECIES: ABC transporter permease [unclassified Cryobacterium]MDY7526586.1 ABC transporter permease [Cryobacterium sp. 10C2]MDY7557607.1 ABC transporter permease [Cryobacterium sp. 10C3]MEB0290552.1 ABC transporter permease [Cryobacterium sp. 10C2]